MKGFPCCGTFIGIILILGAAGIVRIVQRGHLDLIRLTRLNKKKGIEKKGTDLFLNSFFGK